MLATSIIETLTAEGRNKVTIHKDDYTINKIEVGALLLKVVIKESFINKNATTLHIRKNWQT